MTKRYSEKAQIILKEDGNLHPETKTSKVKKNTKVSNIQVQK